MYVCLLLSTSSFFSSWSLHLCHWLLSWVLLPARPTAHFGTTLGLKTSFSKRSTAPVLLKENANSPLVLKAPGHSQQAEWLTEITSWASVVAAVNLCKGFLDYETSPDFKSALGWAECDWIFISGLFIHLGPWLSIQHFMAVPLILMRYFNLDQSGELISQLTDVSIPRLMRRGFKPLSQRVSWSRR